MKVRKLSDDGLLVWYCPACECNHGGTDTWTFNGDFIDKPTFSPSFLVRSGHYITGNKESCWCTYNEAHPEESVSFTCYVCHTFVTDGNIHYLSDCTHDYAGKIIGMVDV